MRFSSRWSSILMAAAAVALPLKSSGCGHTSCITVTQAQMVNGMCPGANSNLVQSRLISSDCPGPVASVDGPGNLSDGDLCCYPITPSDSGDDACGSGVGGGFGETVSTGTGFGGAGGFGTGGFGGTGGTTTMCATCEEVLGGTPFNQVCDPSQSFSLLSALQMCACNGTCMAVCDPTLCLGNQPDGGCLSCLQSSCNAQLAACQAD